ncbi:MAG: NUDIX hydrolase [Candidatus Nanoarchaeia archaeon]|nr:NUDIX hydrolase [Candidatus Nanoarchaeia archaeon]
MERPKVGVGVFVLNEGKVLMGQRINSHGSGTWSLPGGHLEFFESFEDCAKREVKEEVGIEIKDVVFAALTNDIFEKENKHYITIFVKSKYDKGTIEIMEPDKCLKWDWFSWDNLPDNLFLPLINLRKTDFNPFK